MKFWIYVTQDSFELNCSGSLFSQVLGEFIIVKVQISFLENMELKMFKKKNQELPWESKFTKVFWKTLIPLLRAWQVALSSCFWRSSWVHCLAVQWTCQPSVGPWSWPLASTQAYPHLLFKIYYCSCFSFWEIASVVGVARLILCDSFVYQKLVNLSPSIKKFSLPKTQSDHQNKCMACTLNRLCTDTVSTLLTIFWWGIFLFWNELTKDCA